MNLEDERWLSVIAIERSQRKSEKSYKEKNKYRKGEDLEIIDLCDISTATAKKIRRSNEKKKTKKTERSLLNSTEVGGGEKLVSNYKGRHSQGVWKCEDQRKLEY